MSTDPMRGSFGEVSFELKKGMKAQESVVCPRLLMPVSITNGPDMTRRDYRLIKLRVASAELYALEGASQHFAGNLQSNGLWLDFDTSGQREVDMHFLTNNFVLSKFEKMRNGGDFRCKLRLCAETISENKEGRRVRQGNHPPVDIEFEVPQSEWIKILEQLGHKRVFLMEVPKLEGESFVKAAEHLSTAYANLSTGEYGYKYIAVECQQALEQAKAVLKTEGMFKEGAEIDFTLLLDGSDTLANSVETIYRKLWHFFQKTGRHSDYIARREYAEFSVLLTYALLNMMVKNIE